MSYPYLKREDNTRHSFNNRTVRVHWEEPAVTDDSNSQARKSAQLAAGGATLIPYFQVPEEPRFTETSPFAALFHQ